MGLFKKKVGGSAIGNLLRAGTSKIAPGLLGTGANRIEHGQTKTNAQLAAEAGSGTPPGDDLGKKLFGPTPESKTMTWVLAGCVLVFGGVAAYFSGMFNSGKKQPYKVKRK